MAATDAPPAQGAAAPSAESAAAPAADAQTTRSTSPTTPTTPAPASRETPSAPPPPGEGAQEAAPAAAPEAPKQEAQPEDVWERVVSLDADELVAKHPALAKRLGALADKQARQRVREEEAKRAERDRQAERQRRIELARKAQDGDYDAKEELAQLALNEYGAEVAREQERVVSQRAEDAARAAIFEQHAKSFGLDLEDDAVAEAVQAPSFDALNVVLVKAAKAAPLIDAMWEHPAIQERHAKVVAELEAKVKQAREAGTQNGTARAIGSGDAARVDLAGTGSGTRLLTELDVARRLQADPHDREALELWGKHYRRG